MANAITAIVAALVLAVALLAAGFLAGGRYSITVIDSGVGQQGTLSRYFVYEVDRFTGTITACFIANSAYQCLKSEGNTVTISPKPPSGQPVQ